MTNEATTGLMPTQRGTADRAPRRARAQTLSRRTEVILGIVGIVALLLIWEGLSRFGILPERVVPAPIDVLVAGAEFLVSVSFWGQVWATLWITLVGIGVTLAIAMLLAQAIHTSRIVEESTWFIIEFLKPIPGVALIPLMLLLWGPTDGVKLFLIVFGAVWPLLTQLLYGYRELSGVARDVARSYQVTPLQRVAWISWPSLMPFMLTGLRISVTIALIIAIVTEYIVGIPGIGAMLALAQLNGAMDQAFALLFLSGVLGLGLSGAVTQISKPILFWHPSVRSGRN